MAHYSAVTPGPYSPAYSFNQQCALVNLLRSSYYYQPVGESAQNLALTEQIDKLFTARPEMGVRRIYHELKTTDTPVNVKRIRRLDPNAHAVAGPCD